MVESATRWAVVPFLLCVGFARGSGKLGASMENAFR